MMANVLVVDDDADSREAVGRFLEQAGHTVYAAQDGGHALNLLGTKVPDVIVLDYRMPDMDGVTVLNVLRSYLRWAQVPVMILTAYPDEPRLWNVDQLGVSRVFVKSKVLLEDLAAAVEEVCSRPNPSGPEQGGAGAAFPS
jgi:CheY-like chemotaxis protein